MNETAIASLSRSRIDQVIDEHFEYERTDNVNGVLATMLEDAVHDTVGSPTGPLHGREQARAFYEKLFADIKQDRIETIRRYYGADFVVDESHWYGHAIGSPLGIAGNGRPLNFRILHVFELSDDGRIRRENVWLDIATMLQQLG